MVAQIRGDLWAVRRCHDRRRRIIGTLTGAEVDVLRLHLCLENGDLGSGACFVWNTTLSKSESHERCQALSLQCQTPRGDGSLLDDLILTWGNPAERTQIVDLVMAMRRAPKRPIPSGETLSSEDQLWLERLLEWPSTKRAFAASEGVRISVLERKAEGLLKAAIRITSGFASASE